MGWAELRKPAEDVQILTGKSRESLYVEGAGGGAQRTERAESRKTNAGKRDLHPSRHVVLLCHDWSIPLHDWGEQGSQAE